MEREMVSQVTGVSSAAVKAREGEGYRVAADVVSWVVAAVPIVVVVGVLMEAEVPLVAENEAGKDSNF